ncbi:hypothetical protein GGS24DRAFT_462542 [Hypoxylon argillaceum]|nr:hypothetical protein GGS24DRAFT_462542 [Hypoxylon argillaceum]
MATLRPRRFLRCFYCGQRSNLQFKAQKSFDCPKCDATNWLDRNGEITDPPTAAENLERNNLQYAIPRHSAYRSPSPVDPAAESVTGDSVFCATCLRNQQILSSSLAQFEWPDDASGTEHKERERKFWNLRRSLEKRYPQVCEECLSKVNKKLQQASYMAQTDHLRRMVDRTRSQRTGVKKRSPLDVFDFLGKLSWYTSFALQAAWHTTVASLLLTESYASVRHSNWIPVALGAFHRMSAKMLPQSDWIMKWAILIGMCSFPWNPRFKQSIRGFTAHILGFRQWYTYQLLIIIVRFIALSIAQYSKSRGLPAATQLGPQLVIVLVTAYVYLAAKKSIHTDTTPLFRRPAELTAGLHMDVNEKYSTHQDNFSGILDDILTSPLPQEDGIMRISSSEQSTSLPSAIGRRAPVKRDTSDSISDITRGVGQLPQTSHCDDEMDWSPSASQHRAFSSYNPYRIKNTNPRFSDTPIEPKPGPIWYKVPAAPTSPAQRLRNPPMRPIIRESPKEKETFFQSAGGQSLDLRGNEQGSSTGLNLAPAKFYALDPQDDPRDSLSSMFAHSFNISPDPEEKGESDKKGTSDLSNASPNRTTTRVIELIAIVTALGVWKFVSDTDEHYGRSVALAAISVCLMVSVRLAADLEIDYEIHGAIRPSVFAPSLANLALAQVIVALIIMWNVWSGNAALGSKVYGNAAFGSIIIHQVWHIYISLYAEKKAYNSGTR